MAKKVKFSGFLSIKEKHDLVQKGVTDALLTGPLTIAQARVLLENHKNNVDILGRQKPAKLETSQGLAIDGFYFSFKDNDLKKLLSREDIIGVYTAIAKSSSSSSGYTIVIYGVTTEDETSIELNLVDREIFDFCDVCPPKCPRVIY